jgi:hypothetical protein
MWCINAVDQEAKFLANTSQKIIRSTCCVHIFNIMSLETVNGKFEPLFNSPYIPHTRTVSHIHVYFPDPDKDKSVKLLKNKSMFFTIFVTGISLKINFLTSGY